MYTLRKGIRSEAVKVLQKRLNLKADGIFGFNTDAAVRKAQKELKITVDGLAGVQTCKLLGIYDEVEKLQKEENVMLDCDTKLKQGSVPHGPKVYGGKGYSTYGQGGCCPTSITVVIRALYDPNVKVETIGEKLYKAGYRIKGNGTSASGINYIMKQYGGSAEQTSSVDKILAALRKGEYVILLIKKGFNNSYAGTGHYIVARGIQDGKLMLQDVATAAARRQWAFLYTLMTGIKGAYICHKGE